MRLAAKDRREQLMEVALRLFSVQGFDRTTTREIAEAAGVNEAIIFRHFATKEELYWAVVSNQIEAAGHRPKLLECLGSTEDDNGKLACVATTLLERSSQDSALTRLLLFSALRNDELSHSFFRSYMADLFELLADYFQQGIGEGRFRKINPLIAARGFLGMITYHYLVEELFAGSRYPQFDPQALGRELADVWLNGVSAATASPQAPNAGRRNGRKRAGLRESAKQNGQGRQGTRSS